MDIEFLIRKIESLYWWGRPSQDLHKMGSRLSIPSINIPRVLIDLYTFDTHI